MRFVGVDNAAEKHFFWPDVINWKWIPNKRCRLQLTDISTEITMIDKTIDSIDEVCFELKFLNFSDWAGKGLIYYN